MVSLIYLNINIAYYPILGCFDINYVLNGVFVA